MRAIIVAVALAVSTLVVSVLVAGQPAMAQGPGSYARFTGPYGGPIRLDAYFVASDNCQAALSARQDPPAGQTVGRFVAPVTIVIGPNPRGCGNSRVVHRNVTVTGAGYFQLIQIFFVNQSGRILKIERVSIPSS